MKRSSVMCLYTKVGHLVGATPLPSTRIPVTIRTRNGEYKQYMLFGAMASSCDDGGVPVIIIDETGSPINGDYEISSRHNGIRITVRMDELSSSIH